MKLYSSVFAPSPRKVLIFLKELLDSSPSLEDFKETRKEALKKIGKYGKYAALTAIGTYTILSPKKAQAQSTPSDPPGFGEG